MGNAVGDYTDWLSITYAPSIAELLPLALVPHLTKGQSLLEVGCSSGVVSRFLATHGLDVTGIDLNISAIDAARKRLLTTDSSPHIHFAVADIIQFEEVEKFDVVVMIRVLTCFPTVSSWTAVLAKLRSLLKEGGLAYIHDFLMTKDNQAYRDRYAFGVRQGWRVGNFLVSDPNGNALFIAHHHTEEEIDEIKKGYSTLRFDVHDSISMNGNNCTMFEFIGAKV